MPTAAFENLARYKYLGTTLTNEITYMNKLRADCFRAMPVTIGPESSAFPFAINRHKD
jgi:hypothetical protein